MPILPWRPKKRTRQTVDVGEGSLRKISEDVWKLMLYMNDDPPELFLDGDGIIWLEPNERGAQVIRKVTRDKLRNYLTDRIDFVSGGMTKGGKETDVRDARPPEDLVPNLLARRDKSQLPWLRGITRTPVFSMAGECCTEPGYNKDTGFYYDPCGLDIPWEVPNDPTLKDIDDAVYYIEELLRDFPFTCQADKAHAIGAMVQPFVRPMIDGPTPLYLIEKPTSGTGATLLAHVLCYPALGQFPSAVTEPKEESEWRRSTLSWLRDHPQVILIDNLGMPLKSGNLASILTAITYTDRVIGSSDSITVVVDAMWIATGNNPYLSVEMNRRAVRIRLDAHSEHPDEGRMFKYLDLRAEVSGMRPMLVWSILTMVQAWVKSGRQYENKGGASVMGMYDNWARVIGGILSVAGIEGFLENRTEQRILNDTDTQQFSPLFASWSDKFGDMKVSTFDLWSITEDMNDIDLGNGPEHSRRIRLGKLLSSMRDRQIGDFRVEASGLVLGRQTYRLIRTITHSLPESQK